MPQYIEVLPQRKNICVYFFNMCYQPILKSKCNVFYPSSAASNTASNVAYCATKRGQNVRASADMFHILISSVSASALLEPLTLLNALTRHALAKLAFKTVSECGIVEVGLGSQGFFASTNIILRDQPSFFDAVYNL